MSLDVYLEVDAPVHQEAGSGIFVRENGVMVEISREEWDRRNPGVEPVVSRHERDDEDCTVYWRNITHNLGKMAGEAGIYKHLWRPDEIGIDTARQLIDPLSVGLRRLLQKLTQLHDAISARHVSVTHFLAEHRRKLANLYGDDFSRTASLISQLETQQETFASVMGMIRKMAE